MSQSMRDLSWVRKQGKIIEREKKRIRQTVRIPLKKKLDTFAELYETFDRRFKDTEPIFRGKRLSEKIELQNRIRMINFLNSALNG